MRSDPGRVFVDSLNQEQVNRKWESVGEPHSGIEWMRDLRTADQAETNAIAGQAMKLDNQNEVRGVWSMDSWQASEQCATQTRKRQECAGRPVSNRTTRHGLALRKEKTDKT